jgi:hypothetical protein
VVTLSNPVTDGATSEFVCKGCYRIRSANPRLKADAQEYCSRSACQRLRMNRWEQDRSAKDAEFREHRRETKRASRRKCAARDAARLRDTRAQQQAGRSPPVLPEAPAPQPPPQAEAPLAPPRDERAGGIQPGLFLIRPANAPESATQAVEILAVLSGPSDKFFRHPRQTRS